MRVGPTGSNVQTRARLVLNHALLPGNRLPASPLVEREGP